MRLGWRISACALVLAALAPGRASGIYQSIPFSQGVGQAKLIVAGTVIRVTPVRVPGAIVTRYLFTDLAYAKGSGPRDSLTLTSEGGMVGDSGMMAEDVPHFELGRRYVSLVEKCGWPGCDGLQPMCCVAGPFVIAADSVTGVRVVCGVVFETTARPLAPWSTYRPGSVPPPWRNRLDPEKPATESAFLDEIRAIVREQAEADSSGTPPRATQTRDATPVNPGPPAQEATPPQPPVRVHPGPGGK